MAYGAATTERPVRYGDFQITVVPDDDGFEAWIERADGGLVSSGYSLAKASATHKCATVEDALSAAKALIDTGEVRLRP